MPFTALLRELVEAVEGATGAILLESAGEAVQWHSANDADAERLRLRCAYVAVMLQNGRALAGRAEMGEVPYVVLQYDDATFVAQAVDKDYFIIVELDFAANVGQAMFRMQPILAILRRELAA